MEAIMIILFVAFTLTGCMTNKGNDMPEIDQLDKSPCACKEVDYKMRGFKWVG